MKFGRRAYIFACWAYVVLLPVQVLLAGMGIMGGDIEVHMGFGAMVLGLLIPLLMLVFGLIGKIWKLALMGVLLSVILHAIMFLPEQDNNWVAGLHPAIAVLSWPLVYFWMLLPAKARLPEADQVVVAEPAAG